MARPSRHLTVGGNLMAEASSTVVVPRLKVATEGWVGQNGSPLSIQGDVGGKGRPSAGRWPEQAP